jgi:hypothetical protein
MTKKLLWVLAAMMPVLLLLGWQAVTQKKPTTDELIEQSYGPVPPEWSYHASYNSGDVWTPPTLHHDAHRVVVSDTIQISIQDVYATVEKLW